MLAARAPTAELIHLARRLFWWKSPGEALGQPNRFLAQAMTLGTWEDLDIVRRHWSPADLRAVLAEPPPGVFDPRSWTYWHCVLEVQPMPPLPQRRFA